MVVAACSVHNGKPANKAPLKEIEQMKTLLRAALVLGTLGAPMVTFAGDAPKADATKKTDAKAAPKTDTKATAKTTEKK